MYYESSTGNGKSRASYCTALYCIASICMHVPAPSSTVCGRPPLHKCQCVRAYFRVKSVRFHRCLLARPLPSYSGAQPYDDGAKGPAGLRVRHGTRHAAHVTRTEHLEARAPCRHVGGLHTVVTARVGGVSRACARAARARARIGGGDGRAKRRMRASPVCVRACRGSPRALPNSAAIIRGAGVSYPPTQPNPTQP